MVASNVSRSVATRHLGILQGFKSRAPPATLTVAPGPVAPQTAQTALAGDASCKYTCTHVPRYFGMRPPSTVQCDEIGRRETLTWPDSLGTVRGSWLARLARLAGKVGMTGTVCTYVVMGVLKIHWRRGDRMEEIGCRGEERTPPNPHSPINDSPTSHLPAHPLSIDIHVVSPR